MAYTTQTCYGCTLTISLTLYCCMGMAYTSLPRPVMDVLSLSLSPSTAAWAWPTQHYPDLLWMYSHYLSHPLLLHGHGLHITTQTCYGCTLTISLSLYCCMGMAYTNQTCYGCTL